MFSPSKDAFRHIRRIQIKTKKLVEDLFAGIYRSAFKGKGLEFEDVRDYQPGDDIRSIDWNVTARMDHPYVKNFREERELTVMLIVDISYSSQFSSQQRLKSEVIAEMAAVLAFSAIQNQDKVGLILFSDEVELYLSPKKGTRHVLRVIRELLVFKPKHKGTNIQKALSFLGQVQRKRSVCFFFSDFLTEQNFEHEANLIANRHELIVVNVKDAYETSFPNIGLAQFHDLETDQIRLIDTADSVLQNQFKSKAEQRSRSLKSLLDRIGAGFISLQDNESYPHALHKFFKLRGQKH